MNLEVIRVGEGFRVVVYVCPGSDEMIERLDHFALFADASDAKALMHKIETKTGMDFDKFNLDHWFWHASDASPFGFMHKPSKAIREKTPRPYSGVRVCRD